MEGFRECMQRAAEALDEIERGRESVIAGSRAVVRLSKRVVHAIHLGDDPSGPLEEMAGIVSELMASPADAVRTSAVQDALMEYAEAAILESVTSRGEVPSWEDLGIPVAPWVLGLADCVGELRRVVASRLMDGDLASAGEAFGLMEGICGELMLLDVHDAVAPVRRKQDIARGIMDRTRSDMTTASVMGRAGGL